MPDSNPTAALVIIGNEILSGRTKDANLAWLGEQLAGLGIPLKEVRVVADDVEAIISAVNALRVAYTYVFTTGGIGPTHDDITSACVAEAFGVELHRHPDAEATLLAHYRPEEVNEARMKMADVPKGAALVANPVSAAPGYRMENVFVFAGVPSIMRAMFDEIRHELRTGDPIQSRSITVFLPEGTVAQGLAEIQATAPSVDIGSYPLIKNGRLGCSLVSRSSDPVALEEIHSKVRSLVLSLHGEIDGEA